MYSRVTTLKTIRAIGQTRSQTGSHLTPIVPDGISDNMSNIYNYKKFENENFMITCFCKCVVFDKPSRCEEVRPFLPRSEFLEGGDLLVFGEGPQFTGVSVHQSTVIFRYEWSISTGEESRTVGRYKDIGERQVRGFYDE